MLTTAEYAHIAERRTTNIRHFHESITKPFCAPTAAQGKLYVLSALTKKSRTKFLQQCTVTARKMKTDRI